MFSNRFNIGVLKHPGYNIGGGIGEAALIGAAMGGAKSLATGDDVLEGALLGGITGGAMSGITGAVFGKEALAGAAGATGEITKNAVTPAITNSINAGVNVADDVALASVQPSIAANQGLTGLTQNIGGINTAQGLGTTGVDFAGKVVDPRGLSTLGETAIAQPQTFADTLKASQGLNEAATTQSGIRGALGLKPDSLASQGLDWYGKQDLLTKTGLGGAAGFGMGALEPRKIPELEKEEKSKLAGYDPDNFTAYVPETPNPYYSAKYAAEGGTMQSYAQGGITALAQGGMGGNMGYPQGRLDTTRYASPSQMPTSAQADSSDYEASDDQYMGSPLRMAEGGEVKRMFGGGIGGNGGMFNSQPGSQVYYDPKKGQYYTYGNPMTEFVAGNPMMMMNSMAGGFGSDSNRQYIGADGRPVNGGGDGKFGEAIQSANGTIGSNFQSSQPKPEVYQQAVQAAQAPMTDYNPNTAAVAAQSVASPAYDAMMEGVAPQDFNRVFSQITNQTPYAPPPPKEEKKMASGGIAGYSLGGYAAGGNPRLLKGPGDGMSDNIPAVIGNKQPARLADGEFVVPADVVSHLGNGSTDAGAKHLYKMMDKVRTARTGKKAQGKQIKPEKFMPR
jgi:hypothetical protein